MKNKGPQQGEANVTHSKKFHKSSSSRTKSVSSSFKPKKFKKKTGGKGKTPTAAKGKVKAKVANKGRCFQFTGNEITLNALLRRRKKNVHILYYLKYLHGAHAITC